MSKIFITGMSAQHASPNANTKNLSFAGVINAVLNSTDRHEITWASPSIYMTKESLEKYDLVLVGVSPVTSVGANRVYGALNVISEMWGSGKLKLFTDSPNKSQIEVSLRATVSNSETITKPFFSSRKEYSNLVSDNELLGRVMRGAELLFTEEWPVTVVASLPWNKIEDIKLPKNAKPNLNLVNLDSHLILKDPVEYQRTDKWSVDTPTSKWTKSILASVSLPSSPMKWNKGWDDEQVFLQIGRSIGAIISPEQKDGTWWSYRYIQALNSNTPVVTEWKESQSIGLEWAMLASSIDSLPQESRNLLAMAQRDIYLSSIKDKKESLKNLENILGVK